MRTGGPYRACSDFAFAHLTVPQDEYKGDIQSLVVAPGGTQPLLANAINKTARRPIKTRRSQIRPFHWVTLGQIFDRTNIWKPIAATVYP